MAQLPLKSPSDSITTRWKALLDPLLANPINGVQILENIQLAMGSNSVNHLLGKKMQGWFIVDINAAATIYRSAPFNDLILTLTSSAAVTVNIGVF